jgi:hypothetical protein
MQVLSDGAWARLQAAGAKGGAAAQAPGFH